MRLSSSFACALMLAALLVGGCSLLDSEEESITEQTITDFSRFSQDSTLLVGKWDWRRTICCFGNLGVETPENTGDTSTLVITQDDTVDVYRNETLERREALDEHLDGAQWGVTADTLVVSWMYIDGPQNVYVREE
jgi:hypothetical protein